MGNHRLEYCSEERDLGVIMRADLKVGSQCAEACMRANKMLGLIKRTFVARSTETMINLYKTIVRPHLEYCVSASPHYIKDKLLLEKMQILMQWDSLCVKFVRTNNDFRLLGHN